MRTSKSKPQHEAEQGIGATHLVAALAYVRRGLRAVLLHEVMQDGNCSCGNHNSTCPSPKGKDSTAKHPREKAWQENHIVSVAAATAAWGRLPTANIGLCPNEREVVLDIDPRNGGDETFKKLVDEHGEPAGPCAITGGGGHHYWLKLPDGIDITVATAVINKCLKKAGPGIDLRTCKNQVVVEPSLHRSGRRYRWVAGRSILECEPIVPNTGWLRTLGLLPDDPKASATKPSANNQHDDLARAEWGLLHARLLNPDNGYHDWFRLGPALKPLGDEGLRLWIEASRPSKDFDEPEIRRKWIGITGSSIASLFGMFDDADPGWRQRYSDVSAGQQSAHAHGPETAAPAPPTRSSLQLRLRRRDEIMSLAVTRWLIKSYVTCGSVILIGADPNLGKSTIVNAWAHCIWTGHDWLGHRVLPGSALFILGEDVRGASLRANAWEREYGPSGDIEGRYIEYADRTPPLCQEAGQLELRRLLQFLVHEHGHAPAIVIIDTLSTVWGSEPENAAELAAALMSFLSALANEFGCTFVLIHHLNKAPTGPAKREITLSSIRGASAFVGSADDVLVLEAVEDGVAKLFGIKARNTDKAPAKLLRVHRVALGVNEDGDEVSSVILVEAPLERVLDPADLEEAQRDDVWNKAEAMVARAVETLRKLGRATSLTSIANRMVGKKVMKLAAVSDALARGLIINVGTAKDRILVVAADQEGGRNTPHTPEAGTGNRSSADAGPGSVPGKTGTGSPNAGTGNRSHRVADEDDGRPEQRKRRRRKAGGA